uniref:Uncharacterized protein n=1 Tax=Rhizophora mucronata TaxID=61149 RepID=A0A2P2NRI3_RHIMU
MRLKLKPLRELRGSRMKIKRSKISNET